MGTLEGYVEGMINLSGGGGGGTSDYEELENKPSINNVTLSGNKTTSDLNISYEDLENKPSINNVILSGDKTTSDLNISYNDLLNKPYINNMPPSTGADIGDVLTHTSDGDNWVAPVSSYSESILYQNSSGASFNNVDSIDVTLSDNIMNYKFLAIEFSNNEATVYRNVSVIPTSMIDQSGTNGFCSTIVGGNAGFAPIVKYAGNNLLHLSSWGRNYTLLLYKIVGINF